MFPIVDTVIPTTATIAAGGVTVPVGFSAAFTDLQTLLNSAVQASCHIKGPEVICKCRTQKTDFGSTRVELQGTRVLKSSTQVVTSVFLAGVTTSAVLATPVSGIKALVQGCLQLDDLLCSFANKRCDEAFINGTLCVNANVNLSYLLQGAIVPVPFRPTPAFSVTFPATTCPNQIIISGSQCFSQHKAKRGRIFFNIPVNADQSELTINPILPFIDSTTGVPGLPIGTTIFLQAVLTLSGDITLNFPKEKTESTCTDKSRKG